MGERKWDGLPGGACCAAFIATVIVFLFTVAAAITAVAAVSDRPNVVFILVDDLGWSDTSYNGSPVYETPNVDRLAQQGMVFSDFYAAGPVCSPTRASILTGKYPVRIGITTYLLSPSRDPHHVQPHLPLDEFTLAEAFKKNGFATGFFGKWHLGYENEHWARHQGFDAAKGGIDLPWAWQLCYPEIKDPPTARTWPKQHQRFFSPYHLTHLENGPPGEYLTDRLTDESIHFIEQHRDGPFFLFLSYHTVHTPLQAKPEKIEKYRRKIAALGLDARQEGSRKEKASQNNAAYAAMVEHMDENVGRLLRRIDELRLSDRTIVVWTSDNGGKGSVTSNLPLRGMKHNLYEGGIRVPLIVRWPRKIAAGSGCAVPLISNDFYPTLLELTGCPLEPHQHVDGASFRDLLLGDAATVERDAIYWHYPHGRQEAAVRSGRYKLLHRFKDDRVELYDVREDIGERRDLSGSQPELAQRMLRSLKGWQRDVGAKYEGDDRQAVGPMTFRQPVIEATESATGKPGGVQTRAVVTAKKPFGLEQLNPIPDEPRRTVEQLKGMSNVLFIAVDDWNDWVGCLGHAQALTPNVDRLAGRGLLFTNAHCVAPVCNPSRVAVMTGMRPETTGVYENNHIMRRKVPDIVTLSQHFMQHGYEVVGGGKIYHDNPAMFDKASWNGYYHWHPSPYRTGGAVASPYSSEPDPEPATRPSARITRLTKRNFDWAALDRPETDWPDTKVAQWAASFLTQEHDRPFFLAAGIFRPHVPWFNPRPFVEQYPIDDLVLPTVKEDDLDDLGARAKQRALDKASRHERLVEFGEWKPAVQAYLASISFADANVGRVLDALENGPHRDNTVVVLWSDHGYHLGEKGHWHKRTLWERSTRVPLIVSAPGVTTGASRCSHPVSLLDIYPTLIELCGLDKREELEGHSLVPLLRDPVSNWEYPAVTTWRPGNCSIRTDRWRYIRYETGEEELYDHTVDSHEWNNLAADTKYEATKRELAKHLRAARVRPAPDPSSGVVPQPPSIQSANVFQYLRETNKPDERVQQQ